MRKSTVLRAWAILLAGILLAACSGEPDPKAVASSEQPTSAVSSAPVASISSAEFNLESGRSNERTFVLLPAIITHAEITFRAQIPVFKQYGRVLLVDYPNGGLDYAKFTEEVLSYLANHNLKNPYFVGTSWGSQVAVALMREYQSRHSPNGPISGFISVCGPTEESDLKTPARFLYNTFKDTSQEDFGPLLDSFSPVPKRSEVEVLVTRSRIREMRADMKSYDVKSFFAHVRELVDAKPPRENEFPNVRAWIMRIKGMDKDTQIKDEAALKLAAAFPSSEIVASLPGTHANLIEHGFGYAKIIAQLLDRQF